MRPTIPASRTAAAIKNPEEPARGALIIAADEDDVAVAPELAAVPDFEPVAEAVAEADEAV